MIPPSRRSLNGHPEMYDKIPYADALKWRKEWMDARAAYIQNKIDNGLYTASSDQVRRRHVVPHRQ